ncbi:MAG: hexapeptide transferase [Bacteroidetes bacterium]|nr:MAG: hexapeptide transferase [Bacteroidota bacterium]
MNHFFTRTAYLFYYARKLDRKKFVKFLKHARKVSGHSAVYLLADSIRSVYRYNIGWIDYFLFRFFEKSPAERSRWAGTGYKYEYDLVMNPKDRRNILENKIEFYEAYRPFVRHATCSIGDLETGNEKSVKVLENPTGKIVIKDALGQCGWEVEVVKSSDFSRDGLIRYMKSRKFNLAEEYIIQHPEMARLSDSGVNTVRIITQVNGDHQPEIFGARLRVSVNNHVDNMASDNIAAAIDIPTGRVTGPGVFSDITRSDVTQHPVTGVMLDGFRIPMWEECIDLVKRAASLHPENRSIGWDVVITTAGPQLLEGNHNWCKILWQVPVKTGLKQVLDEYLAESFI